MDRIQILPDNEVSAFLGPNETTVNYKSFMETKNHDPHFRPPPVRSNFILTGNLNSEFSRIADENCKNNTTEAELLPEPSQKETVRVYLRVKPKTEEESQYYSMASTMTDDEDEEEQNVDERKPPEGEVVSIESDYQIALHAPNDSNAYKNSINNGNGKLTHRYTFTKIFSPKVDQGELFSQMVLPRVQDFLEGRNQLIFTYGATCSGKTFTIQGDTVRPGILPRALDTIFNSISGKQLAMEEEVSIKPLGFNRVAKVLPREAEQVAQEKRNIIELGNELTQVLNDQSQDSSQASIVSVKSRTRDSTSVDLAGSSLHFAVWVSFAEIYNENIYDLFEKIPEAKKGVDETRKPRRIPLTIGSDKASGSPFIRNLKEVFVNSADEAYQLLLIGRKNLQFAATRLNQNSSRSHCIFTIKVVRVADKEQPHCARVSMLSFCDLAGSERIKKTLNTGERQKEAGNINTSLLVLGRVIKELRHNQNIKDPKRHHIVPFRDSKLTRLFQSYFTGLGKASMIVNISQSPYLFDESLQVLKFSAIASKVQIEVVKEPKPPVEFKKPMEEKKSLQTTKRQTRFSIMVENNKRSLFGGRGSIAWENPQFRSTMCQNTEIEQTVLEESEMEEDCDATNVMEDTVIDSRYDGFMKVIDNLKNQLIEERQKNLKLETDIRTELCDEFNNMMVEIETSWQQRLQEEKDRASELSDWRIGKLEEALKENRKKKHHDNDEIEKKLEENKKELDEKTNDLIHLRDELEALKNLHNSVVEDSKKLEADYESTKSAMEKLETDKRSLQEKLATAQAELQTSNNALKDQNTEPKIEELEKTVKKLEATISSEEEKISDLKTLLDEAKEDYMAKDSEISKLQEELTKSQRNIEEKVEENKEMEFQLDEFKILLSEANSRADENEEVIREREKDIEKMREKLEKHEKDEEDSWSKKKATEQQITTLSDEIESLKAEKKKLRALADERDTQITAKDKEIDNMEKETKNLLKAEKQNQEKLSQSESEIKMLRKQLKDLNAEVAETKSKQKTIDNLQIALEATKKEETAVSALKEELNRKSHEKDELQSKVDLLQAQVDAKEYDFNKLKDDRDTLMNHYEQKLKKMSEELAVEKRENAKMSQLMHSTSSVATPSKKKELDTEKELNMLRDELEKKSELVKTLAAKVTTPKRNKSSNDEELEKLRQDVESLTREKESLKANHDNEIKKVKMACDKLIEDYKETNSELLKHVPAKDARRVMSVKRTVHDSDDENVEPKVTFGAPSKKKKEDTETETAADTSIVGATPSKSNPRRGKRTRAIKKTATTQVSFEDSTVSNITTDFEASSVADADDSNLRKPKRGSKVSKSTRPGRRLRSSNASSKKSDEESKDTSNNSSTSNSSKLHAVEKPSAKLSPLKEFNTPVTPKKRKLFSHTPGADVFTPTDDDKFPVDSPHSIVKRNLRSRRRH